MKFLSLFIIIRKNDIILCFEISLYSNISIMKGDFQLNKKQKFSLVGGITALIITLIHFINKYIFFTAKLKEKLYSENSNCYNWRFGQIFYTKKGSGPPLLLIHDMNCASSEYEWKDTINQFAENHTVYGIDLLGFGRSEKVKITYTSYLFVQLISDFIKNIIKQKTDVIVTGKSSSSVLLACYIDHQLFHNIILVNPDDLSATNLSPKRKHKVLKYVIDFPILGTLIYNIIVSKSAIKDDFRNTYFFQKKKILRRQIDAYYEAAHLNGSSSKYIYSSIRCHYMNTNIIHALKELNNNICVIVGDSVDYVEDIIDGYISFNPSIETYIFPNSKKLPQMEHPKEFVATCKVYLE